LKNATEMGVANCEKKLGEWVLYDRHCPMHFDCHLKAMVKREEMLDFSHCTLTLYYRPFTECSTNISLQ